MIQFNLDTADAASAASAFSVSVIGIGGSGTNVIDKIALEGMAGAELVSMNCDARALNTSMAETKLQLGKSLTQGLGCGGDPELGAEAAMASQEEIRQLLAGRRMVFLCVGLGGGTGSGAAPLIARMAREAGAFVVVFATLPFAFEGRRRSNQAGVALQDLRKYANALITFENDRMGELVVPKKGVQEAFELADKIIGQSVRAVTNLVTQPGLIHIGMDDLITALRNTDSRCLFGYGQAKGENRAVEALALALKSPLIDRGQMLSGARNVLVHICGGSTLTLFEIETLMRELGKHVHDEAQILFGAATDAKLQENLSVTILTSLSRPLPVAEMPQAEAIAAVAAPASPAVTAPAESVVVAELPAFSQPVTVDAVPPVVVEIPVVVEMPVVADAAPVTEAAPPAVRAAAPPVAKAPAAPLIMEEELFPSVQPAVRTEPGLIEIPALVASAAPAAVTPAVSVIDIVFEEPDLEEAGLFTGAGTEPEGIAPTAESGEPELAVEEFEEESEELIPAASPEGPSEELQEEFREEEELPEEIPEEVQAEAPVLVAEYVLEPVVPVESREVRPETAPTAKRFVLSDIIKREPKPAPIPEPVMEYEALEEEEAPPAAPVRPAPVPRRAPDFDRVSPIRPIPAGRSNRPVSSPFTAAKPVAPTAPVRPVPTQQQTFDERLQPATNGGRFDRVKPTVEEGEDLDVPTFLRRKR